MYYKAVIFDFDYTLGDCTNGIVISVNYALDKLGYSVHKVQEIKKTVGLSLKETFFKLSGNNDFEKADRFCDYFKEKADVVMVDSTVLLPGTLEVLKFLKDRDAKIGIVTTKFHYRINQILNKFHIGDYVDMIIGAEDVKIEKPNPEGILYMIKKMEIDNEEALYIGDSLVDAETAERANVDFIGITTGTTQEKEFQKYCNIKIISKLSDLIYD
ncbi:HAD family hydrolase [Clostridium sp.]|uniref:HAD family hydrolase n=1 Tax=Clostridium sp. TaxID=1506 RepID=UPI00260B5545|nr:HAD family hydrolase [Clostridium sp.]